MTRPQNKEAQQSGCVACGVLYAPHLSSCMVAVEQMNVFGSRNFRDFALSSSAVLLDLDVRACLWCSTCTLLDTMVACGDN